MTDKETISKSHIISPYACKKESEIESLKTRDEETKEILCEIRDDIKNLTQSNERIAINEVKIDIMEKKIETLSSRLWYVIGATLVSIISVILNMLF